MQKEFRKYRSCIYTFENRCIQDLGLRLGDDATKIILNTKGTMDDITPEMKKVLDFIDGKEATDDYIRALEQEIEAVRKNEKWRLDYMTLQMRYREKYEQGIEQGIEQSKRQVALKMLKKNKLSIEDIAMYTGLTIEQVEAIEGDLQIL